MASYWPWLAVAGVGALHGLNPASGWMFAAAWGVHSRDPSQALRALMPIAVGHATSVALVAGAIAIGLSMDRVVMQVLAGALVMAVAIHHFVPRTARRVRAPAGKVGLALWSFMMSSAHGAGLMLVPVLMPLCIGNTAEREITASGSLTLALAAVGVHTAAMLAVTGVIATGIAEASMLASAIFEVPVGKGQRVPMNGGRSRRLIYGCYIWQKSPSPTVITS